MGKKSDVYLRSLRYAGVTHLIYCAAAGETGPSLPKETGRQAGVIPEVCTLHVESADPAALHSLASRLLALSVSPQGICLVASEPARTVPLFLALLCASGEELPVALTWAVYAGGLVRSLSELSLSRIKALQRS